MARKLGESLVERGIITQVQLQRARTAQLVHGGHLTTNLLEQGSLSEDSLGRALSSILHVPYSDARTLAWIPGHLLEMFPSHLAEKHRVIPLRQEGRRLHLAMMDPANLLALDEISFVTGYTIVATVALEVRIVEALEKHYGVTRSRRFAALADVLSEEYSRSVLAPRPAVERAGLSAGAGGPSEPSQEEEPSSSDTGPLPRWSRSHLPPLFDQGEAFGYGKSWRDIADGMEGDDLAIHARDELMESERGDTKPQPCAHAPVKPESTVAGFAEAVRRLAAAECVDDVLRTVVSFVAARLPGCMVLVPKDDELLLWASGGDESVDAASQQLSFPREGSIVSLLGNGESSYLGAVPRSREIREFYKKLHRPLPRTVLITTIVVQGRVASYLYADGGTQEILAIDLPSIRSLCARAGFALQVLILRKKILHN
ncbi:MAG: hypothetical protein ACE5HU_09975 [Acidobacteriota bacterium]